MNLAFLKRLPRGRQALVWLALGFVLYTLAGFFLLPPLIRWQLVKQLPALTRRQAAVQQVQVNPWALSLTIRGLALSEPDGRPFAAWDELYVNFQASSLFRWAWTFAEIRVAKPFAEVILFPDGRLNLANLFAAPTNAPPKPPASSVPRIHITHLVVTNGFVALEDRTRRSLFRTEYRPINLNLRQFTTRPNADTPYSFHAECDAGRSVTWAGDLTIQPLRSAGRLDVTGIMLSRYQPYLEDFTRAVVTNGLADAQCHYRFAVNSNGVDVAVTNGAVQVAQVQVLDPATGETVVGIDGIDVQQARFDLRQRTVELGAVKVSAATVLTRLDPTGRLNLLDLLPPSAVTTNSGPAAGVASPPWTATVDEFTIERAAVGFEDRTRRTPFQTELKPIEFTLKRFTTGPDADARYTFQVTSEAAEVIAGAGTVSVNPLRSAGELKFNAVDVKKYLPYAEAFFRGRILSGQVEARIPYRLALGPDGLQAGVTNLAVTLGDLQVQLPESPETVTHVASIGGERVDASLEDRRGRVGLFKGSGGSFLVRRDEAGVLNLLGLLAVAPTNAPPAPVPSDRAAAGHTAYALGGWTLDVDEIQLDDYTVKVEDRVPTRPATNRVDQLSLNVKGLSTASDKPITARVSFRLNETATLSAQGTAVRAPGAAEGELAVTRLELRAAQPYLDPFVALELGSGTLTTAGRVRFQTHDPATPRLTFAGDLQLTHLVTTDPGSSQEFVGWDELAVTGIRAVVAPNELKIDELRLVRPRASLLIGADGRPNLARILKQPDGTTPPRAATASSATNPPPPPPAANPFPVQLGSLVLDRAAFTFADDSVQPRVTLGLEELSGSVKGIASAPTAPAEVDLRGRVNAQSPFSVTGRVNPFPATRFVDLTLTNANTDLTPLTGYLEKFGGYPLKKGRLSTRLRYQVEGQALQAENSIQVDQLLLGARNQSPDATSLPLKLGVALLKDSNGRIELDVPVGGRLDDPEFSLGPIVLKVILNTLVKAAASPFKLLGALAGGGGDELSFVEFVPGTTNLVDGELDKLDKLAAALAKRPALNLEIEAAVDPARDGLALARARLDGELRAKRLGELAARGRAPGSPATFVIEPEERNRLLRAAFVEQFGTNLAAILQTNQARLAGTNQAAAVSPPKVKRGLLRRLTGLFGGGTPKAEKRLSKTDREALGQATPELMETLLAEQLPTPAEAFDALRTARSRWVYDWLQQAGQVAVDRLLLAAPKPVDPAARGEPRVNLALN